MRFIFNFSARICFFSWVHMYLYARNTPRGFGHGTNHVIYIHIIHVHNTGEYRTEVYNDVYRRNIPYTHTRARAQTKVRFRRENRITISRPAIILFSLRYIYVYICSYIPWSWGFFSPITRTVYDVYPRVIAACVRSRYPTGKPGDFIFRTTILYYFNLVSADPGEITAIRARVDVAAPISRAVN